jgi:hypothetical protein
MPLQNAAPVTFGFDKLIAWSKWESGGPQPLYNATIDEKYQQRF